MCAYTLIAISYTSGNRILIERLVLPRYFSKTEISRSVKYFSKLIGLEKKKIIAFIALCVGTRRFCSVNLWTGVNLMFSRNTRERDRSQSDTASLCTRSRNPKFTLCTRLDRGAPSASCENRARSARTNVTKKKKKLKNSRDVSRGSSQFRLRYCQAMSVFFLRTWEILSSLWRTVCETLIISPFPVEFC